MPLPAPRFWRPECGQARAIDLLTYACPLHDPVLEGDCGRCTEQEQQRAAAMRRQRQRTATEETTMGAKGTGFWTQMHVGENGTEMPRLDLARRMLAEGRSKQEIERTMGAPTNSLLGALRSDEVQPTRAKGRKPVPLQETPPAPEPTDDAAQRDPLEARLPVQEGSGLVPARPADATPAPASDIVVDIAAECAKRGLNACSITYIGTGIGYQGSSAGTFSPPITTWMLDQFAAGLPETGSAAATHQQLEQSDDGILRAFADSDACEVIDLVFEFIEYKQLEAECELFIRFGQWRATRERQQAG
jgi:hypothetical protein